MNSSAIQARAALLEGCMTKCNLSFQEKVNAFIFRIALEFT